MLFWNASICSLLINKVRKHVVIHSKLVRNLIQLKGTAKLTGDRVCPPSLFHQIDRFKEPISILHILFQGWKKFPPWEVKSISSSGEVRTYPRSEYSMVFDMFKYSSAQYKLPDFRKLPAKYIMIDAVSSRKYIDGCAKIKLMESAN